MTNKPNSDEEREAMTVEQLIGALSKMPPHYTVNANVLRKYVIGIDGVTDIGGDYFSQVFLENFDHDADIRATVSQSVATGLSDEEMAYIVESTIRNMGDFCESWEVAQQAIDNLRAANAFTPQVAGDGWLPIETAPKDGTYILVSGERYMDEHLPPIALARWINETTEHWERANKTTQKLVIEDTSRWGAECGLEPRYWLPISIPLATLTRKGSNDGQ